MGYNDDSYDQEGKNDISFLIWDANNDSCLIVGCHFMKQSQLERRNFTV